MGNIYSLCLGPLTYSRKKSKQVPFNEFYFVNTFCRDKNVKEMADIAVKNGYNCEIVHYNNRYLGRKEVFSPTHINFYTYKYSNNVVEYAVIG